MGKSQRTKGHSFERAVAKQLRSIWPDVKRHLESQSQEAKGYDLDNTGDFRIQVKALNRVPNIPAVFKEFSIEADKIPVVIFKRDGQGTFACFKIEDALTLLNVFETRL